MRSCMQISGGGEGDQGRCSAGGCNVAGARLEKGRKPGITRTADSGLIELVGDPGPQGREISSSGLTANRCAAPLILDVNSRAAIRGTSFPSCPPGTGWNTPGIFP